MSVSPRVRKWLTSPSTDPSVRARYWAEIESRPDSDRRLRRARAEIGRKGWAASILECQLDDGQWFTRGSAPEELYRPKYVVTNWLAIVLADLGMTRKEKRIDRTAKLIMDRWGGPGGDLSGTSGEICVTGNAVRTLVRFGFLDHPVVQRSIRWIVETQKADGGWHCFKSRTGTLDGWEGLAALAEIPESERDSSVRSSIARGAEFYLDRRLMNEGKARYAPWFRIHYPNHYFYDVLVGLRILTKLGYASDPRMAPAFRWLRQKRRTDGTWALDASHPDMDVANGGYAFDDFRFGIFLGSLQEPNPWVTVEALSILTAAES